MKIRILRVGQRRRAAVLMSTLALLGTAAFAQLSADRLSESAFSPVFEAAQLSYERNHWPQAFAAYAALADSGHAEAARIALQMARLGPALYGSRFAASDGQRQRWAALVATAGDAAGAGGRLTQRAP